MSQNLRLLFDRALADEPEPPPSDLAGQAIAAGTSLRRRRHRLMAVGVAGAVTIAALTVANVVTPPQRSAPPVEVPAGFAMFMNPACAMSAGKVATHASVFLTADVTDQQRSAVDSVLRADSAVQDMVFESRDDALARYREMFKDAPDLVASVQASQLPESFRIKLAARSHDADLMARVGRMPGVDEVITVDCPSGTNAWEVK